MHIQSCLSPKKIFNPYTKDFQMVPCGTCSVCLNRRSSTMVARLEQESKCWKYTYFITLTYSDNYLPKLSIMGDSYVCLDSRLTHPKLGVLSFDRHESLNKVDCSNDDIKKSFSFENKCSSHFGGLPFLSKVDAQRFVKRLRSSITREFKTQKISKYESSIPQIRYYLVGEYGPSCYRPHYHVLLWFSSCWLSSNIERLVRKNWKFGDINSSFVKHTACSYVAKYLNCFSHLPAIYRTRCIRPFALYSKHPALGTLIYRPEDIRQLFLSGSLVQTIEKQNSTRPQSVYLWRTLSDKLYPRLAHFDKLTHTERVSLYSAYQQLGFEDGSGFYYFFLTKDEHFVSSIYRDYLTHLESYKGDLRQKILRWFVISSRVCAQAASFGISVREYVKRIETYYDDVNRSSLSRWYNFANEYVDTPCRVTDLFGIDYLFLERFRDCDLCDLDCTEVSFLLSFGIDMDKFFSSNLTIRYEYQYSLLPSSSKDYILMEEDNNKAFNDSSKTKRKVDYLLHSSDPFYNELLEQTF